jgi:hypothetical protein
MHGSGIPIWFFIGVMLAIYGALVLGYGFYELATGLYPAGVQLTQLHTPIWWGALLFVIGVIYLIKFFPRRSN